MNRTRFPVPAAIGAACLSLVCAAGCTREAVQAAGPGAAPTGLTENTDMLAKVFPSIVRIEAIREQPRDGRLTKAWVGGSGVIVSAEGYLLTNCHVAEDANYYRCYLYDGEMIEAVRIGQDPMTDLAVLKLDLTQRKKGAAPLQVAPFGDSDKLVPGNVVFALGSPGFLSQSSTRGIVANPTLTLSENIGPMMLRGENVGMLVHWILHDATIYGGNSGGPLVNAKGEVIGINEIGVVSLSGAIPANLARDVADQIIRNKRVIRGWSGITVQEKLESLTKTGGVVVSDVAEGSPAAAAGVKAGDVIVAAGGTAIEGEKEKAVANYYRIETAKAPGTELTVDFLRGDAKQSAKVKLESREPAQADDREIKAWGAVVRDLTRDLARDARLPEKNGVWIQNIRPGGAAGQAEPDLRVQDVIIGVNGQPVNTVADLVALTDKIIPDDTTGTKTVLASIRRDGAVLSSVVELWLNKPKTITPTARRAWLGVTSQPLTPKLATQLGVKADGGARVTRVHPGTKAEAAGLKVGDIILAVDGQNVEARRQEDSDVLARMIRQYRTGTEAKFSIWRETGENKKVELAIVLEAQPTPSAEMPEWEDLKLEYEVRDVAFDDRVRLQLPGNLSGVLVSGVVPAGWAYLAGLRSDDLIMEIDGTKVATVAELQRARNAVVASGKGYLVMLVYRRGETGFIEINLKQPLKP
jgi:serine protease Do